MKHFINYLMIAFFLFNLACDNNGKNKNTKTNEPLEGFIFSGTIYNCDTCLVSISYDGVKDMINDSIQIKDNNFHFKGHLVEPQLVELKINQQTTSHIFLTNGEEAVIDLHQKSSSYEVLNGKAPSDYLKLKKLIDPFTDEIKRLDGQFAIALEADRVHERDSLYELIDNNRMKKQETVKIFVIENPMSPVGVYALITTYNTRFNELWLEQALMALDESIHQQHDWKYLKNEILLPAKLTQIGNIAPTFEMKDTYGKSITLESFRGKVVLLDFWASWCVPCRKANVELSSIYSKYNKKGFEIISISLDKKEMAWTAASEKDNIKWVNFCDLKGFGNKAAKLYGIKALPTSFLIDQQGVIISKNPKHGELIEELNRLLLY